MNHNPEIIQPSGHLSLIEARRIIEASPKRQPSLLDRLKNPVLSSLVAASLGLAVLSGIGIIRATSNNSVRSADLPDNGASLLDDSSEVAPIDLSNPTVCIPSLNSEFCLPDPDHPERGSTVIIDPGVIPGSNPTIPLRNTNI